MNIRLISIYCFCLLALIFAGGDLLPAQTNPNHKEGQVDVGLAVHGTKFEEELPAKAQAQYETARDQLQKLMDKAPGGLSAKTLGDTHLELFQLKRKGELLVLLGESAGLDYILRCKQMNEQLQKLIDTFAGQPSSKRALDQIREKLRNQKAGRDRALAKIEDLANQGKWLEAENLLYKAYDTLDPDTCLLTPQEWSNIYSPFMKVQTAIDNTMKAERIAAAQKIHAETRAELAPDFQATLSQVNAAIDSVGKTGSATWKDETVTGPQLAAKMGEAWSEVQVATLRCRSLDWLYLGNDIESAFMAQQVGGRVSDKPTEFENAYATFAASMTDAFVRLIETDARRATADQAKALYVAYLEEIAPLARLCSIDLPKKLETALGKLAAVSPALADEIAKYKSATDELLRWRKRTAESLAANRLSKYTLVTEQHFKATTSTNVYRGLYPIQNPEIHDARMLGSAPEILAPALKELMGKTGTVSDFVRLSPTGKMYIGRYQSRTYATMLIEAELTETELAAALESLKRDLMVTDNTPPLSLQAMIAVKTAERGDFRAVGGAINGMYLESLMTRFAALPQAAGVIIPLGEIPREPIGSNAISHLLMRYEIAPHWLQHDYFFLEFLREAGK